MTRRLSNWITAYLDYTAGTEAPRAMHFWTAVSCVAGVLRRRVWIDMTRFKWYPNFFIIFVAPPGIVSKTTTMDLGIDLLKQVPGIKFGPDVVTWQSLVKKFAESGEMFQFGEDFYPMSALTLASGELGNLINPQDRDLINIYIALWDGRGSFAKETKMSGNDTISAPWVNMIGCTTPHWIADNMPAATIGGGFTSRCIFVYADEKVEFIAYPDEMAPRETDSLRESLIADLEYMAVNLIGSYTILEEAREWGRAWYRELWTEGRKSMTGDQVEGYLARKQTHMHKLAMVLSAAERDDLVITKKHLQLANMMLESMEKDLNQVFSRIGRTEESLQAERLLHFIRDNSPVPYEAAYQHIHLRFPDYRDFEGVMNGLIRSGQVKFDMSESPDPAKAKLRYIPGK